MMRYAYFPGCSARSTGKSYTASMNYIASRIGLELIEIPDWNCCGTSAARLESYDLGYALPARNMALAEAMDPSLDVVAPCAGCYQSLAIATRYARESAENLAHLQDLLQMPYEAKAKPVSLLEAFSVAELRASIAQSVVKPLAGLRVACYYGCALVRPTGACSFDDPENPQSMDCLMRDIGADPIDWAFKTECCGAAQNNAVAKAARPLIERIFQNAAGNGADAVVMACPLCMLNLDMREGAINKARVARGKAPFDLPCYYFTELIGLALGGDPDELGIRIHFVEAMSLLERKKHEHEEAERAKEAAKAARQAKIAAKRQAKQGGGVTK